MNLKSLLCTFLASVFLTSGLHATQIAYVTGENPPWKKDPTGYLDAAFGTGNYDYLTFGAGRDIFTSGYDFIYIDGGNGQTLAFEAYINANRTAMETWVSSGGSIFLNAARWYDNSNFDLGFGATLTFGTSLTGTAVGDHEIFDASTGRSWTGTTFSHDTVSGADFTSIIDGTKGSVLAERSYGAGHVMVGGLTVPELQSSAADAFNLRVNILQYGAAQAAENVPDGGSTVVLLGLAMSGVAWVRRKTSN